MPSTIGQTTLESPVIRSRQTSIHPIGPDAHLLMDSFSGALDIVDDAALERYESLEDADPATAATLERDLVARGYAFDSHEEEEASRVLLMNKIDVMTDRRTTQFVVCPTGYCNFRCVYCYESEAMRSTPTTLSSSAIDAIFDQGIPGVERVFPTRPPSIQLFGGEPLLPHSKGAVEHVLQRAQDASYPVSIISNGFCVNHYRDLLEGYAGVIDSIQITLDGPAEVHNRRRKLSTGGGTFDQVVSGIDTLLELGIAVRLRINLDAENVTHLPTLSRLIVDRGWNERRFFYADVAPVTDHLQSGLVPNLLREDELLEALLPVLADENTGAVVNFRTFRVLNHLIGVIEGRHGLESFAASYYCEANKQEVIVFGHDGIVYPCPECIGDIDMGVGRFMPDWELDEEKLAQWADRTVFTLSKCIDCSVAGFCGGGCAYAAIKSNGDISDPVCNRAPELVSKYIESRQGLLERLAESATRE